MPQPSEWLDVFRKGQNQGLMFGIKGEEQSGSGLKKSGDSKDEKDGDSSSKDDGEGKAGLQGGGGDKDGKDAGKDSQRTARERENQNSTKNPPPWKKFAKVLSGEVANRDVADKQDMERIVDAVMLFKRGIRPEWEDEMNRNGGELRFQLT